MRTILDKNQKKAWIKIVESFISVMIVMSVVVVMISRQPEFDTQEEELNRIQKHILDQVADDVVLRNNVLEGDIMAIEEIVDNFIPEGFSFIVKTCPLGNICSANIPVTNDIFAEEIVVAANLTQYSPTILKLFFWQTSCGNNYCETNFGEDANNCEEDCAGVPVCDEGEKRCFGGLGTETIQTCSNNAWVSNNCNDGSSPDRQSCLNGACTKACGDGYCNAVIGETSSTCAVDCGVPQADIYVSNWQIGEQYTWNDGTYDFERIDWNITISNNNSVDWEVTEIIECWETKLSTWENNCNIIPVPVGAINVGNDYVRETETIVAIDEQFPNTFNLTYLGQDSNGYTLSITREINFS